MFWKQSDGTYTAAPYNFYVIPEGDRNVTFEVQTMIFLRNHDMDFNRWLYDGVPYVNAQEEATLRKRLLETAEPSETDRNI
jgi:poly(A)-specific ribonuclease